MKKLFWTILLLVIQGIPVFAQVDSVFFTLNDGVLRTGSILRRNDIYFDLNKSTLRPEDSIPLDSIAKFIILHPEFVIEVGGHYPTPSTAEQYFSAPRALSVCNYLISKGVPKRKLKSKGYGGTKPVISQVAIDKAKTKSEKDSLLALNRRIEFKILSVDPHLQKQFSFTDSTFYPGEIWRSYTILYDLNKPTFLWESKPIIDSIGWFLIKHPGIEIEVSSHTDQRASDNYNQKLSLARANSVRDYLVYEIGIGSERITSFGYGESMPMVSEDSILKMATKQEQEKNFALSRRTEFKITAARKINTKRSVILFSNTTFSVGDILPTRSVLYDFCKFGIRPEGLSFLDSISDFMKKNPSIVFEIGDYSGSHRGGEDWVNKLSQQRSDSIKNYLVGKGIPANRLQAKGYGMSHPIITMLELKAQRPSVRDPEDQPDTSEINRRVEFKIIELKK
jgi:outer membrane protein OmpA-like peptidoglycan-associated protein